MPLVTRMASQSRRVISRLYHQNGVFCKAVLDAFFQMTEGQMSQAQHYTLFRDAILTHPTMAEGLNALFAAV